MHPSAAAAAAQAGAYEEAYQQFRAGRLEVALVRVKQLLQAEPDNIAARFLAGRIYLRLGDGAAAQRELQFARDHHADPNLVLVPLATAYMLQGQYARLLVDIQPIDVSPEVRAELLVLRARAHLALEQIDEAAATFTEAARAAPDSAAPQLGLARVQLRVGDLAGAERHLRSALELEPDDSDAWLLAAEIRRLQGDLEGALTRYGRAVALAETNVAARIGRAAVLIDLDRDAEALPDLEYVRKRLPHDPQAGYLLALIKARAGDVDEAARILGDASDTLARLDPEFLARHAPSLYLFGVIAYQQGRIEEAAHYLRRFVAVRPRHPGALKLLGRILLQQGRPLEAMKTLEPLEAAALKEADAATLTLLGRAYFAARHFDRARALFTAALQVGPADDSLRSALVASQMAGSDRRLAHNTLYARFQQHPDDVSAGLALGLVDIELGRYDEAIRVAARLHARTPRDPAVFNLAGAAQLGRGELAAARLAFERALALKADYRPARLNLAAVAIRLGERERAAAILDDLLANDPEDRQAMMLRAQAARSAGDLEQAIAWLEKVRAHDRSAVEPALRLAELYLHSDSPQRAEQVLSDLAVRQPDDLRVLFHRARVEIALGKSARARATLRKLTRLAGFAPGWLYRAARLQADAGDARGARWSLNKALQQAPGFLPAERELTQLALRTGRYEEAAERARRVRDGHPGKAIGHLLVGDVALAQGRAAAALEAYRRAAELEPSAAVAGRLFRATEQHDGLAAAIGVLEQWLSRHPEQRATRRLLAGAYVEAGRQADAVAAYERLLREGVVDSEVLNNLAWLYFQRDDPRARRYAERAWRLAPSDPAVLDTYGWILVHAGQGEQAVRLLRAAQVRLSRDPTVRYHLAVALARSGQTAEAREHLTAALATGRPFRDAGAARSLLERLGGPAHHPGHPGT